MDEVIMSRYITGSEGHRNLFFRAKGTEYVTDRGDEVATDDLYIIQWQGLPGRDSGYSAREFKTLKEAVAEFSGC